MGGRQIATARKGNKGREERQGFESDGCHGGALLLCFTTMVDDNRVDGRLDMHVSICMHESVEAEQGSMSVKSSSTVKL